MDITFRMGDPGSLETDALVVPVLAATDGDFGEIIAELDGRLDGQLAQLLRATRFTGACGKAQMIPTLGQLPARRLVFAGLGDPAAVNSEAIRQAYGAAATAARDAGATHVTAMLPTTAIAAINVEDGLCAAAEAVNLALYRFTKYFGTGHAEPAPLDVENWTFVAPEEAGLSVKAGRDTLHRASTTANATILARELVNEPGNVLNPAEMAARAAALAEGAGLEFEEYGPTRLAEINAGAILAVGRGSVNTPRLLHLVYRPPAEIASGRKIGLVGKSITFDTGGYSIKTGEGMLEMKSDMAGGAAVLGVMSALTAIGCPHEVHGVICAAENMISGEAFHPGDVLTAMNGVTIEVISTDAEGRLVLADGLVFAARQGAEELIDLATLTGAAIVALGETTAALFATDDQLAERIQAAGKENGEDIWRLPLTDALEERIKSEVADIKNSGGRSGGSILAALFLRHFREGLPWAHIDIAGTAMTKTPLPYAPKGATGFGVRSLLSYLKPPAES